MKGLAAALAFAAAAAAGGCGDRGAPPTSVATPAPTATARVTATPTPTATPTATPRRPPPSRGAARIRVLLDRRAAALRARDVRALAATAGLPAQAARDRAAALAARGIPLAAVAYRIVSGRVTGDTARARVRLTYAVAGVRSRQSAERRLRLRRAGGRWTVAAERAAGARLPWELGPYRAARTRRFVVLAPRGIDPSVVGATLETARAAAARTLPAARLRERILVVVGRDASDAGALAPRLAGVDRLAAVTDATVRTSGPALRVQRVVSLRLLIPWPRFAALDAAGRRRVVAHELTHAALMRRTSGRVPAWLLEGVALYASGDRRVAAAAAALRLPAARPAMSLRALARPDAITRLRGPALTVAYAYASAATERIVARWGERGLSRLYLAFGDPGIAGRPGPAVVDRALRAALGVGAREFERALLAWLRLGGG